MISPSAKFLVAALCLPLLAGCSNGKFKYGRALGDLARVTGVETGLEENDEADADDLAAVDGPPLIVGFEAVRVALPFAGESGESKTYVSPDGVTLAMNNGFVTRAIGLGVDLNGAYLPDDSPWFDDLGEAAVAGASTDRVFEYWDKRRLERDKFRCTLASSPRANGGAVVDETCKRYFQPESFTNRYWLTADGGVECSRQWFHPKLSPLQFFATEQQALTLDLTKNGC